jgi:hypothetical protein
MRRFGLRNVARARHMHGPKTGFTGRGPTEEVEQSWLGAEAMPGGRVHAGEDPQVELDLSPPQPRGAAAWVAAVLSWARRRHST